MHRAAQVIAHSAMQDRKTSAAVLLDHDRRYRRRLVIQTDAGESILLDLPAAVHLRQGDGLLLDDGRIIAVRAVPEPLLEIAAPDMAALMRIAWHLGNRHIPTQLSGTRLLIRNDHVLAEMVRHLGGTADAIEAAFDPEGGAYAGEPAAGDHHHHGHGHHHNHDHDHE